jgi:hypothetical protein
MPRTETILTVFVASPSDVSEERDRLQECLEDWNRGWARNLGVRLELVRWENDAYPGIGDDGQDVINRQIPQDYDIFVGIMGNRFGTQTGRAESGTAEEFQLALSRHRSNPGSVEILFYFKDAPIAPSKLDFSQIQKVHQFKSDLRREGLLYWEFSSSEQFEKLVTLHLTKYAQKHLDHHGSRALTTTGDANSKSDKVINSVETSIDCDFEDGYIDYLADFEEGVSEVTEISVRLSQNQEELTALTEESTKEMLKFVESQGGHSASQIRRSIAKQAAGMKKFTDRTNAEIPLLRDALNRSMSALTRVVSFDVDSIESQQMEEALSAALSLFEAMKGARQSMEGFRESTIALPKMTKELNRAKRSQADALEELITVFVNGEQLLGEAIAALRPA